MNTQHYGEIRNILMCMHQVFLSFHSKYGATSIVDLNL